MHLANAILFIASIWKAFSNILKMKIFGICSLWCNHLQSDVPINNSPTKCSPPNAAAKSTSKENLFTVKLARVLTDSKPMWFECCLIIETHRIREQFPNGFRAIENYRFMWNTLWSIRLGTFICVYKAVCLTTLNEVVLKMHTEWRACRMKNFVSYDVFDMI